MTNMRDITITITMIGTIKIKREPVDAEIATKKLKTMYNITNNPKYGNRLNCLYFKLFIKFPIVIFRTRSNTPG